MGFHLIAIMSSYLFYLNAGIIEAQNIVPFPTGTSITPLSAIIANEAVYNLKMTGATTTRADQMVCTGFTLPQTPSQFWIIGFEGTASASVVHHMTLYGCDSVPTKACGCGMASRSPLYSWVRNTPKVRYTGTGNTYTGGFRIGGTSDKKFIFLEIHYHGGITNDQSGITIHTTATAPAIDLAIYPVMGLGTIPANQASYNLDACTSFPLAGLFYLGFQVHSHNMGRLVTGYVANSNNQIKFEYGQGNPLWPQAYIEITPPGAFIPTSSAGDQIYTRCVYSSSGVSTNTNTNGRPITNYGEMCIFNILVASFSQFSTKNAFLKGNCDSTQVSLINDQASSTTLLTAIPDLDTAAAYGNITSGNYPYRSGKYTIRLGGETFTNTFQ